MYFENVKDLFVSLIKKNIPKNRKNSANVTNLDQ